MEKSPLKQSEKLVVKAWCSPSIASKILPGKRGSLAQDRLSENPWTEQLGTAEQAVSHSHAQNTLASSERFLSMQINDN